MSTPHRLIRSRHRDRPLGLERSGGL